jgi:predicted SprT family Zn-dependent metalloprotease
VPTAMKASTPESHGVAVTATAASEPSSARPAWAHAAAEAEVLRRARRHVAQLAARWGAANQVRCVEIAIDARLSASLARCSRRGPWIKLNRLLVRRPDLLAEAVAHEFAHLVTFARNPRARPHGPQWRALMAAAGFPPRLRVRAGTVAAAAPPDRPRGASGGRPRRIVYRCPVCQSAWVARRRVTAWRCGACAADGLSGELLVEQGG